MTPTLVRFVVFGVLGWVLENSSSDEPPRYSQWVPSGLPFLPIYGVGGVLQDLVQPALRGLPWYGRAGVYGALATALELGACQLEQLVGVQSWGYGPDGTECVDPRHSIAWAAVGLASEQVRI